MIFEHMDRIVFAGDSVTDMESAQPVGEGLFENVPIFIMLLGILVSVANLTADRKSVV